jgi:hypothetical protein
MQHLEHGGSFSLGQRTRLALGFLGGFSSVGSLTTVSLASLTGQFLPGAVSREVDREVIALRAERAFVVTAGGARVFACCDRLGGSAVSAVVVKITDQRADEVGAVSRSATPAWRLRVSRRYAMVREHM